MARPGAESLRLRDPPSSRFAASPDASITGLFRRGKWEAAAEDLRLASSDTFRCGLRFQVRIRLAWAYHELGKHAEAASVLAEALSSPAFQPTIKHRAAFGLMLADFYDLDGKPDLAKRERDAAATLHPNLAEAANNFAWGWLTLRITPILGENERFVPASLLLARKAIELAPGEPMYQNTYGLALYRSGRLAEAKAALSFPCPGQRNSDAWDLFPCQCASIGSATAGPPARATKRPSPGCKGRRERHSASPASWPTSGPRPAGSSG